MMQRWSRDTIRFMTDASQYGAYYKELTAALLPYLPTQGHVCDAGCGLGYLAKELSKYCKEVTAIDASAAALEGLLQGERGENLKVIQGDILQMEGDYDAMVFCYFGKAEEILTLGARQCRDKVLVVRRDCSEHRFSTATVQRKQHSINTLTRRLQELGIPHFTQGLSLELGQPFRSFEDALCFFELYNKSPEAVDPEALRKKLLPVEQGEFTLYYPNRRDMELIVFSAQDLRRRRIEESVHTDGGL